MGAYQKLLSANKEWARDLTSSNPKYFPKKAEVQKPEYLWIGCSDSRVPAEVITGSEAGELFVHRNIANLVVHTDFNLLSVLQFAVEVLRVDHVIVCGHYGCGGIENAMSNKHLGLINKWLRHIKDVYRFHEKELNSLSDDSHRLKRLVELNVLEQVQNLAQTSIIQSSWKTHAAPMIHGWVYDMETGLINDISLMKPGSEIDKIYQYDLDHHVSKLSEEL